MRGGTQAKVFAGAGYDVFATKAYMPQGQCKTQMLLSGFPLFGSFFIHKIKAYQNQPNAKYNKQNTHWQEHVFEEVAGKGAKQLRFDEVPISKAAPYAAEDAEVTLKLHQTLYPMMSEQLKCVLNDIEIPLLSVLADMERHGVLIDTQTLIAHGERLKARIQALEEEALALANKPFNLNCVVRFKFPVLFLTVAWCLPFPCLAFS